MVYWVLGGLMAFGGRGLLAQPPCAGVRTYAAGHRRRSAPCCIAAAGWPAAWAFCWWFRSVPCRCWPKAAPAWAVAAIAALGLLTQQILAVIAGNAQTYDYLARRDARRSAVPGRADGVAGVQPPARERGAGAAPGARPGEPRAAVAIHRAASAREHPGGGPVGSHPSDQRVGGPACSATTSRYPGRCWARSRRDCCTCCRPGAATTA